MKHGSLFSGIGGFDLASEWMGWENVFHCEIAEFPRKILHYYWPNSISYENIKETDFTIHRGGIDILTGGFPCQPFSMAGKRKGTEDERHLWPEMLRAIREIQPSWIVGENVFGIVNWDAGLVFEQVQSDLEAEGYEVQAFILPAAAVNAPHRRDRVWFVAYANERTARPPRTSGEPKIDWSKNNDESSRGRKQAEQYFGCSDVLRDVANPNSRRLEGAEEVGWDSINVERQSEFRLTPNPDSNGLHERNGNDEVNTSKGGFNALNDFNEATMHTNSTSKQGKYIGQKRKRKFNGSDSGNGINNWQDFPTQSPICGGNDGLPTELDGITFSKWRNESIKGYGNAIVPQVVLQIFKAIQEYESQR